MSAQDPIDLYLGELKRRLVVRGRSRRRVLAEVRAHLLEAADAERSPGDLEGDAAARAVTRFGPPAETAREFNRGARHRRNLARRALVPSLAAVALTSLATATVLAFYPSTSPLPAPLLSRALREYSEQRRRCERAAALAHEAFPRGPEAFPPVVPIVRLPCGRFDEHAR